MESICVDELKMVVNWDTTLNIFNGQFLLNVLLFMSSAAFVTCSFYHIIWLCFFWYLYILSLNPCSSSHLLSISFALDVICSICHLLFFSLALLLTCSSSHLFFLSYAVLFLAFALFWHLLFLSFSLDVICSFYLLLFFLYLLSLDLFVTWCFFHSLFLLFALFAICPFCHLLFLLFALTA